MSTIVQCAATTGGIGPKDFIGLLGSLVGVIGAVLVGRHLDRRRIATAIERDRQLTAKGLFGVALRCGTGNLSFGGPAGALTMMAGRAIQIHRDAVQEASVYLEEVRRILKEPDFDTVNAIAEVRLVLNNITRSLDGTAKLVVPDMDRSRANEIEIRLQGERTRVNVCVTRFLSELGADKEAGELKALAPAVR